MGVVNETLVHVLPEEIIARAGTLITILEAVGFAVIIYIVFAIVNAIIHGKRNKEIKKISQNVEEIKKAMVGQSIQGNSSPRNQTKFY